MVADLGLIDAPHALSEPLRSEWSAHFPVGVAPVALGGRSGSVRTSSPVGPSSKRARIGRRAALPREARHMDGLGPLGRSRPWTPALRVAIVLRFSSRR